MAPKVHAPAEEQAPKVYYIVNPHGAIHSVTREHAVARLKADARYRVATAEEVAALKEAKGLQRAGRPLARPHGVEPELDPEVA